MLHHALIVTIQSYTRTHTLSLSLSTCHHRHHCNKYLFADSATTTLSLYFLTYARDSILLFTTHVSHTHIQTALAQAYEFSVSSFTVQHITHMILLLRYYRSAHDEFETRTNEKQCRADVIRVPRFQHHGKNFLFQRKCLHTYKTSSCFARF